jgi:hypothetical protein
MPPRILASSLPVMLTSTASAVGKANVSWSSRRTYRAKPSPCQARIFRRSPLRLRTTNSSPLRVPAQAGVHDGRLTVEALPTVLRLDADPNPPDHAEGQHGPPPREATRRATAAGSAATGARDEPAGKDDFNRRIGHDLGRDEFRGRRLVGGSAGCLVIDECAPAGEEGGVADTAGGAEGADGLAGLLPGGDGIPPELFAGLVTVADLRHGVGPPRGLREPQS